MTTPDGMTKYGQLHYKTMTLNQLFVYTQNFCDEKGRFIKAPFSATYPDTLLTTMTLLALGAKKTKLTVRWDIVGTPTDAEVKTFNDMKPFMVKGWNESFDKLATLVK